MAGDWVPMRLDLHDDPAVVRIAAATGLDEFAVVGRLHRLWSWANRHLSSGNAPGVTEQWIDRYVSAAGFAAAMLDAGWLQLRSGGVEFPNYDRWNSQSAKRRVLAAKRVKEHRGRKCNADSVTGALPEKRREEDKEEPPNPPSGGERERGPPRRKAEPEADPRFAEFWAAYPNKAAKKAAAKAFARLAPDAALFARLMAALAAQRRWPKWVKDGGEFIPHASTWLNNARWNDEPPAGADPAPPPAESFEERQRRQRAFIESQ